MNYKLYFMQFWISKFFNDIYIKYLKTKLFFIRLLFYYTIIILWDKFNNLGIRLDPELYFCFITSIYFFTLKYYIPIF